MPLLRRLALAAGLTAVALVPTGAGARLGLPRPWPGDEAAARRAGREAGAEGGGIVRPFSATALSALSYRVFATQYYPNTSGSVEVAVPDKCAKFASLGWTSALSTYNCPSGYQVGLRWKVKVIRDSGQTARFRVKDVGPWNIDDNWWDPPSGSRPRRLFADLPQGKPEAQAAFYNGYNTVSNCKTLSGAYSGHAGAADQFGRCVLNPAGIDLSVPAAQKLGLAVGQNEWVTVKFLWEQQ